jgi:hypothetical protein
MIVIERRTFPVFSNLAEISEFAVVLREGGLKKV